MKGYMNKTLFSFTRKDLHVEVVEGDRGSYLIRHKEGEDDTDVMEVGTHSLDSAMSIARTLIEEGEVT